MITFTVYWHICSEDDYNLDANWSMQLLWSFLPRRPKSILIKRKSSDEEVWVTGNLELAAGSTVQNIKIFNYCIQAGCGNAEIQLEYCFDLYDRIHDESLKLCKIRGEMTFSNNKSKCVNKNSEAHVKVKTSLKKKVEFVDQTSEDIPHINSLLELSIDFERLLDPIFSFFSDVELRCGSESIQAHKSILSARSSVFADMFTDQAAENAVSGVLITDMDVSTFRAMVTYIYSGRIENMCVKSASNLLFASHKYKLQDLKAVCTNYLKDKISHENALRILHIGNLYSKELETIAEEYICRNCEDFETLEQTEEWKSLENARPSAIIGVLKSLIYSREERLKEFTQKQNCELKKQ